MYYAPEVYTPVGAVPGFELLDPEFGRALSLGAPVVDGVVQLGNFSDGLEKVRLAVLREERSVHICREDGKDLQVRNLFWNGPESERLMFPNPVPFVRFVELSPATRLDPTIWACAGVEPQSEGQWQTILKFAEVVGQRALSKQAQVLFRESLGK